MKTRLRQWAPLWGALLVAFVTLAAWGWRRSPEPVERTGTLLDTYVRIVAVDGKAQEATDQAMAALGRAEAALNRYDSTSTIGQVNRAEGSWVDLDPLSLKALTLCRDWAQKTGGAFDISLGRVLDLYGFGQGGRVPTEAELAEALKGTGPAAWELDEEGGRARLKQPGLLLDLGGMHKGLAVDEAAAQLSAHGVTRGLVDAGGNMRALGSRPDGQPWRIGIRHPRQPDQVLAVIPLQNRAVATSGDYQHVFERDGKRYHHLLDPKTGKPSEGVASVTVLAPTAVEADILSTTLFILGPDQGRELLAGLPGIDALWVTDGLGLIATPGMQAVMEVKP